MKAFLGASLATVLLTAIAAGQTGLNNGDFEQGMQGSMPPGWEGGSAGYTVGVSVESCNSGKRCAALRSDTSVQAHAFGVIKQSLEATPYRGETIRFRAAVRAGVSGTGNQAQLWLRVDRQNGSSGFLGNVDAHPITSGTWQFYEITGKIDGDAKSISLGLMLKGSGSAWLDDASLEIVDPPRPLSARGLDNLRALARLFGYVRYFHPSDASAAADWEQLAVGAVRTVESAQSASELASRLAAALGSAPPTMRIFPTGSAPPSLHFDPAPYLIEWRHHGVGLTEGGSLYYSERVTRPASGGPADIDLFRADLPGGVSWLVPRVLYTDRAGTFRLRLSAGKAPGSGDNRTIRLAAVVIAWNVLQHFYPYFDVVPTDWPQALTTALTSAATDKNAVEFLSTLRRMMAALHDGHGRVTMEGGTAVASPVGWDWVEGRLIITDVADAHGQAIERGDAVVAIDGKPVSEALREAEAGISSATPQWLLARALGTGLHYDQALGAIGEGPKSEPLTLELEPFRQPGARRKVTLERQVSHPVVEPRPEPIAEVKPGILYLDLTRISDDGWQAALPRMEAASGLILDMRGYPGRGLGVDFLRYLSEAPMKSAPMYVPLVTTPDHHDANFDGSAEWTLDPLKPHLKARKIFLTNGRAISFSETIMAIVEHYRLGEIVGGPTAGTNGNTNVFTVPGGYRITWTGMKVLKHDGSRHHGVGIAPTLPVSRTQAGVAAARDEVLERGLEMLK
jgi:C-terminal processing protease CtpA/Prc